MVMSLKEFIEASKDYREGRVLPPLVLWMLGVPGGIAILLWLLVFRGH